MLLEDDKVVKELGLITCVRVNSARRQDSSVGGGAGNVCLGAVHMEEDVQDRVQVEVGREVRGVRDTHGMEQGEKHRKNKTINQPLTLDDHEYGVMRTNTFLIQCGVTHQSVCALCRTKMTCGCSRLHPPSVTVDRQTKPTVTKKMK